MYIQNFTVSLFTIHIGRRFEKSYRSWISSSIWYSVLIKSFCSTYSFLTASREERDESQEKQDESREKRDESREKRDTSRETRRW